MTHASPDELREAVRKNYAGLAAPEQGDCGCGSCCATASPADLSKDMGYSDEELAQSPEGANLGLGCGNPHAIASLKPGETVVDLGSGGGFDCFLAGRQVGPTGTVIGIDMTPEMIAKARENARKAGVSNVTFRLGEIEHVPVADNTADVVMSNCVINLSPEKAQVFREAFRVLKPGGRLAVADVVATAPLPAEWRDDLRLYASCVAGAAAVGEIETMLSEAGFADVSVRPQDESRTFIREWSPVGKLEDYVVSALIEARKPA